MKQKNNKRHKEALKANKHTYTNPKEKGDNLEYLSKDLTVTAISTLLCLFVAFVVYAILG